MEDQYSKSWNKNTMNSLLTKLLLGSLVQGEEYSETREEVKKRKKIAAAKNLKNEVPMIQRNNRILVLCYQKIFKYARVVICWMFDYGMIGGSVNFKNTPKEESKHNEDI